MEIKPIYRLVKEEKESIVHRLRMAVEFHQEISFAYLHGSFGEGAFRDIDVAVYLRETPSVSVLQYELKLESELMKTLGKYSVDIRVLNEAPLSFRFQVIRQGVLLFARDEDERAEFQERTLLDYFDFLPYRNDYLKETLGLGT